MASDLGFVEYVCEQMRGAGLVSFRKMFGEYALYFDGKVIALVCDNQLFVKPTPAGQASAQGKLVEAPPYPGARPHLRIDEQLDDAHWMAALVRMTAAALPVPKPKKSAAAKVGADPAQTPALRKRVSTRNR